MIVKWVRNSAWFYMRAKDICGQTPSLREATETYYKFINEFCEKYDTTVTDGSKFSNMCTDEETFAMIKLACPEAIKRVWSITDDQTV